MPWRLRRLPVRSGWQQEAKNEDRATFRQVVARDLSLMFLNHSISNAEAQAHALTNRFRGIEGIKDSLWFADSRTGVGKRQNHVVSIETLTTNLPAPTSSKASVAFPTISAQH